MPRNQQTEPRLVWHGREASIFLNGKLHSVQDSSDTAYRYTQLDHVLMIVACYGNNGTLNVADVVVKKDKTAIVAIRKLRDLLKNTKGIEAIADDTYRVKDPQLITQMNMVYNICCVTVRSILRRNIIAIQATQLHEASTRYTMLSETIQTAMTSLRTQMFMIQKQFDVIDQILAQPPQPPNNHADDIKSTIVDSVGCVNPECNTFLGVSSEMKSTLNHGSTLVCPNCDFETEVPARMVSAPPKRGRPCKWKPTPPPLPPPPTLPPISEPIEPTRKKRKKQKKQKN